MGKDCSLIDYVYNSSGVVYLSDLTFTDKWIDMVKFMIRNNQIDNNFKI